MFSHVTVGTRDLARACVFYDAVLMCLSLLRRPVTPDGGPAAACWVSPQGALPRFYVYEPFDGQPAVAGNGAMVAFQAASAQEVIAAYEAGIANGGTDEGTPGKRPQYGNGYFGAYLRDPDGNKIHVAYRGDVVPLEGISAR
jgi:catechol 2,3-dioxygenase-like lactoylglutathione lyase family enzyme